jgi:hypothetical protein
MADGWIESPPFNTVGTKTRGEDVSDGITVIAVDGWAASESATEAVELGPNLRPNNP